MILNGKLVETNECPEDAFILLNPRYHPITGELDIEETAKVSVVVTNIGKGKDDGFFNEPTGELP